MTLRLTSSSFAGTSRKLVAVGTARLRAMLVAIAAAAPRIGSPLLNALGSGAGVVAAARWRSRRRRCRCGRLRRLASGGVGAGAAATGPRALGRTSSPVGPAPPSVVRDEPGRPTCSRRRTRATPPPPTRDRPGTSRTSPPPTRSWSRTPESRTRWQSRCQEYRADGTGPGAIAGQASDRVVQGRSPGSARRRLQALRRPRHERLKWRGAKNDGLRSRSPRRDVQRHCADTRLRTR